jgi:hypothetical protein
MIPVFLFWIESCMSGRSWQAELDRAFAGEALARLTLSRAASESLPNRIVVRPVLLQGERKYQWAERRGKQEVHANLNDAESRRRLRREFPDRYGQANLQLVDAEIELQDKGKRGISIRERETERAAPSLSHDAAKNYLIPEGTPCAFLHAAGVMTADGQVRAPMQHKFRQVNRFLELVDDIYPELPAEGPLRVIDLGCGKSYLTFAIHHLLTAVHHREVEIIGIDRSGEMMGQCSNVAERLELEGITFQSGEIASTDFGGPVHLAVSLHACDTATDAALAVAVRQRAKAILAVPCCQHELAAVIASPQLELLTRYGILKERFAAIATDVLRAAALEAAGYRTQVLEFIDLEQTAKNVLIRAVRDENVAAEQRQAWTTQAEALRALLGSPALAVSAIGL